ncbi:MAG TPA: M20/M25/M40 family metallo-hydrolase [Pyrinomonadaceae bacterium]|nr:M20/M25/M40 family metallo-hydrolase [Pyrinomonadaceae bacterium]
MSRSASIRENPRLTLEHLLSSPEVTRALRSFETNAEAITQEHLRIASVPASPFDEHERAEYLRQKFLELGLTEVEIDDEGNCLGLIEGASRSPLIVVSAHLDTVFSKDTDFTIVKRDGRFFAPGIADDSSGLTALIVLAAAIQNERIATEGSILFVGTVGEEGEGNLRGVRHLFTKGRWAARVDAFLSFDGPGVDRITHRALGSRRYRVDFVGPGGHSWGDFGLPNPVHAMGRAISRLAAYPAPKEPRTTFNVGRIEGGTSVNAIPSKASMEVDLRSSAENELRRLDAFFRRAMKEAADEENAVRRAGGPEVKVKLDLIGERPTGETPSDSPLVELAIEATRMLGFEPRLDQASTDSNLPISLGISAITVGAGGASGNSHTLDEWYDPRDRDKGLKRGLLVVLGMARLI